MKVRLSYTTVNTDTHNASFGWTDYHTGESRWRVKPGHSTKTLSAEVVANRKKRRVTFTVPLRELVNKISDYGFIDSISLRDNTAILYMTREIVRQDALQVPYSTTFAWHIDAPSATSLRRALCILIDKSSPANHWANHLKRELA